MSQLLWEILGWLGYLQRGAVIAQLLLIAGLCTGWQLLKPQKLLEILHPSLRLLIAPISVLLIAWLLELPGGKTGLVTYAGLCWLGWNLLTLLKQLLLLILPESSVHQLESRLLRPIFLVVVSMNLISQFDNPADLGVIRLGSLFGETLTVYNLIIAIMVSYLLLVGTKLPAAGLAWALQKLLNCSDSSRKALNLIIRYVVVGIGITAVGFHIGLNSTALVAIAGGLSVGLGFGIKEVFSNFISGIWLLFEGSVRPGEILMVDGDPCEVRKLGLRATLLWRVRDNAELLIPNQMFFTAQVLSYTATDSLRRSEILVGAAYRHDPHTVLSLLESTALTVPRVLNQPAPRAFQVNYGDSAIEYSLRYWIADPMSNMSVVSEVNQAIWTAFKREGIEIPFPQRVNTIREIPPFRTEPDAPGNPPGSQH
tara:strand:- start:3133 stop:4407 length:1275 start_codon:yes stop_codon:yes gene_type:complete